MLWYLAHPVAPDKEHTYEENMTDARRWWVFLLRNNVKICAPWFGLCHALDDSKPEDRKLGMEIDQIVLRRCDGIIATGHSVSKGMQREIDAMLQRIDDSVVDLTGHPFHASTHHKSEDALTKILLAEATSTSNWYETRVEPEEEKLLRQKRAADEQAELQQHLADLALKASE